MAELFASGRVVDLIILGMVVEGFALIVWARSTGRAGFPGALLGNMLAGVGLLLALRGALTGASWGWMAFWLALALLAHVADLWRRCAIAGLTRSR